MFGLSVTGNTFLLWAALGVVLSPGASVVEFKAPSWGIFAAMLGMVLAGLGIGYQIVYLQADHYYLVTMIASQDEARIQAAEDAVRLNPFNDMYRAEVGVAHRDRMISYINAAQQAQAAGQDATQLMKEAQAAYENSVASLRDTINFVSWEYDNYVFLASVHNIGGQALNPAYYDDAVAVGERGVQVEPFGPAIRIELARALNGRGDNVKAIEQAKIAAEMDPNFADAWQFLASLYEAEGETAKAIEAYKRLPGNATAEEAIKRLEASATPSAPAAPKK